MSPAFAPCSPISLRLRADSFHPLQLQSILLNCHQDYLFQSVMFICLWGKLIVPNAQKLNVLPFSESSMVLIPHLSYRLQTCSALHSEYAKAFSYANASAQVNST